MRFAHAVIAVAMLAVSVSPSAAQTAAQKRILKQQQKQQKIAKQQKALALPGPALERFIQMSPEERQRELDKLPPARQQQLMQRLRQFQRLPPAMQQQLSGRYEAFLDLPPPRQQAVRQEIRQLQTLSPAQRRAQLNSAEEQGKFSPDELEILRGVAGPQ